MNTKIVLYSTNCPKCKVIETKLKQLGLNFVLCEDRDETVAVGRAHGITSAPILCVDDECYDFAAAISYLKGVNN